MPTFSVKYTRTAIVEAIDRQIAKNKAIEQEMSLFSSIEEIRREFRNTSSFEVKMLR